MEKYFCNYEQSLALKELGFDEPCFESYTENGNLIPYTVGLYYTPRPLKSQVFEWFRKEKDLYCEIRTFVWDYDKKELGFSIRTYLNPIDIETERLIHSEVYKTYEKAESACIDKLIELLK